MLYIIFNPAAGKGRAARHEAEVRAALQGVNLSYELHRTERAGHAQQLAATAAADDRYTALVAVGGDGTINEIVNGMLESNMPLGFIPIGTGNDWTKMLNLPPNQPSQAVQRLVAQNIRPVDVGVVNGRAFLNAVGCGLDAQIAIEALRPSRLRGVAVYLQALVRALKHYEVPRMRISCAGQSFQRRLLFAAISNGRCQAGGFWLTPDAQIDDGWFDLCICDNLRLDEIVRYVPKVMRGTHTSLRQVQMARVKEVLIESDDPLPVHVDGEILGAALHELHIEVRPSALRVLG
jgi:diacylglycerol kinase (ATP)